MADWHRGCLRLTHSQSWYLNARQPSVNKESPSKKGWRKGLVWGGREPRAGTGIQTEGWRVKISWPRSNISKGSFPFQKPLPPPTEWQGQLEATRGRRKEIPVQSLVS